ncbi:2-hydroxyacid dehydrogenase [Rhodopila globiformis]|uniref:D-glycerate dehydrogenase n=1 Tax=Rhodopila globiformis TaxID=1071 RepID=A0A2S6N611_RHOGL|nr:D-glycerate dehydrogenase [Rhodopila globiformis]PPQ30056.1 D-glycerate dehydrogenase [Rhodopila globiformis]
MAKPVLFVTRRLPPSIEAQAARDFSARLTPSDVPIADVLAGAAGADAILCCPGDAMDAALIAALPDSVKVIGTFSVGYDHVDLDAARSRGIRVCNTPDVLSVATAECAMLLILAAARRAGEGERMVRSGAWQGWAPTQLLGTQVSGRRLGIFGMGRIGRELARMARGFEMEVHYRDVARLPPELEHDAIFHDNDDSFLPMCEVLSLNAPGGAGTRHWLTGGRIAKLPRGAVVVNAARGSLVDDQALVAALREGHVAAAGLDVYNNEPHLDPAYLGLENVVLLPHLGSATRETRDAMGRIVLAGIAAVLAGQAPRNLVG